MKIVAIRQMSAGNECVGEMWKETRIFDELDTLKAVMDWAASGGAYLVQKNIMLSVGQGG